MRIGVERGALSATSSRSAFAASMAAIHSPSLSAMRSASITSPARRSACPLHASPRPLPPSPKRPSRANQAGRINLSPACGGGLPNGAAADAQYLCPERGGVGGLWPPSLALRTPTRNVGFAPGSVRDRRSGGVASTPEIVAADPHPARLARRWEVLSELARPSAPQAGEEGMAEVGPIEPAAAVSEERLRKAEAFVEAEEGASTACPASPALSSPPSRWR